MGPWAQDSRWLAARRVLLVEDDPALALMLTWELEDRGVTTVLATSCAQARMLSRRIRFELALVDVDLPDGDGLVLAEGLAAAHPGATVAIHTGRHGCGPSPYRSGPLRHFLTKPVPVERLLGLLDDAARGLG